MDRLRFVSLASGSSGNCYYLGTAGYGILIDAGIGSRTIKKRLKVLGVPFEHIQAVFVTHDHVDHIKAVGTLGEKFLLPIYATELTHKGIDRSYGVTQQLSSSKKCIEKGQSIQIIDFRVEAFAVSHDATDNVGFTIHYKGKRFTIATDLGHICASASEHIRLANYLVVEANYDFTMLRNGYYPERLKQRICGERGHLDNDETAAFLAKNYHAGLSHVFLCHLSKENNSPEIALQTISGSLVKSGVKVGEEVHVQVLSRSSMTELVVFEN